MNLTPALYLLAATCSWSCSADALATNSLPPPRIPSAAQKLRNLIESNRSSSSRSIILPGIHDALSAKIYSQQNAPALFLSGFGISACRIGQPDVGILTLTEMEDSLRSIVQVSRDTGMNTPIIVDGDTGYGGAVNIRRTVRSFARAGAAAVTIEDQVFPKKCTYAAGDGVRVVSRSECQDRIRAALEARDEARNVDGNDIMIVARTDCRAALGFEEALERCIIFEELGADICYAENLQSRREYEDLRKALRSTTGTILAQVQTGNEDETLFSAQNVGEMGYDFVLFGVTALQAYVRSLKMSAALMMAPDSSGFVEASDLDILSFDDLKSNLGFEDIETFQAKYDC
jgi:2-methylisocitrate lyase-like PEP mutase family enzyme